MKGMIPVLGLAIWVLVFSFPSSVLAQPSASQTIGGVTQQEKAVEKKKTLEAQIERQRPAEKLAEPQDVILPDSGPKVLIHKIDVESSDILSVSDIRETVASFEGKEISLKDAQRIANLISDLYRKKGYITSRAYIPAQTLKDGTLLIRLIEGKLGAIDVKGNKYFSTSLLKKRLNMKPGSYFDYSALQRVLVAINEHPDRKAKVVVLPGKERGTTDLAMDVKDNLPIHVGFGYDNFGSRFMDKNRFSLSIEHNNITGHDDKVFLKAQRSESHYLKLYQGRYVFPVSDTLDIGGYFAQSKVILGREYKDLDSIGKAKIYGVFFNKALLQKQAFDLRLNGGFDYKDINNYLSGAKNSRDALRIFKAGLDVDGSDSWGRNIVNTEVDFGVPDIMGGMESKSPLASRAGSGAEFTKALANYYRLQPLPFFTTLLWKNSSQFTNNTLTASEQFQIGGPVSVRGYPPAERSGDKGYFTSLEWSLPLYGFPKYVSLPFRQEKVYDALRLVTFWDWGFVSNKNPAGEKKTETLKGYGFGTHYNAKDLTISFEMGYPIGKLPSDGNRPHPWVEVSYKF
ncbi:MAG: ShlB/FhaC/HecB family hemolysin secretion/activation protein [Candidatus Omnitrophica bacterium]|nr:ShlB/FhaC/HecB family hemolysin secretion/activation protein [Candidatus Omnitrophota bacterium]